MKKRYFLFLPLLLLLAGCTEEKAAPEKIETDRIEIYKQKNISTQ